MALTKGWLYLPYVDGVGGGSEMQVPVKDCKCDLKDTGAKFIDYSGDGHYGFSSRVYKRMIKVRTIMFNNKADYDTFRATLHTLQTTAYNMRYKVKSTGLWEKWDGINSTIPVLYLDMKSMGKAAHGDDQNFEIKLLILRQAGAITT